MAEEKRLNKKTLLDFYYKILLIRRFEQKVYEYVIDGTVKGSVHLCIGEEASAVGTVSAAEKNDYLLPTHRGHGQALAKGTDPSKLMAEIIGKEGGLCKGRVGSMHFFDKDNNVLGAQGILGAQFPISIGVGLSIKLLAQKALALCYFGDGTSNQGTLFEALNFADIWGLPILFVCINNQYGMGTPYGSTCNLSVSDKAKVFNIRSVIIDGNDVIKVFEAAKELIRLCRIKKRPALIECLTYRHMGHSGFDNRPYRPKDEVREWKKKDPLASILERIRENGIEEDDVKAIGQKVEEIIKKASDFADGSPYPVFDKSMLE